MRACWAATLLVLVPPSLASCATCTGTSVVPRVPELTPRHRHKSPCVQQPFAEISGSTAFSSLWFLSRKLCPIFVCHFKGSLHAEFIDANASYVVSEALKLLFRKDDEFKRRLGQHTNNHNQEQSQR